MKLKFEFTPEEVNAILGAMGEVPSKFGLFPFAQALIAQAQNQPVAAPEEPSAEPIPEPVAA